MASAIGSAAVVAAGNVASLAGLPVIDGVSLSVGQRVLLVGQTTRSQNGPWITASGAWSRPADFPSAGTGDGSFLAVEVGTLYAGSVWVLVGTSITIDTSPQTWVYLPFGLAIPPPSGDSSGATDWAVLNAVFGLAGAGDTIWIRGLYVINKPLVYPAGISVVGTGRNIVEGQPPFSGGLSGFRQATGSSGNFWPSSTPASNTATATGSGISTGSLTVTVTSTTNITVGMAAVAIDAMLATNILAPGTIVTAVVSSTQFTIDRLPLTSSSSATIGFNYGLALLTPAGYDANAMTIDAPSEFVNLFFDGQNRTGPAGASGNTAGHLLILPAGRCRVSNCCFTDSAGCGVTIADSNSDGGAWATGDPAGPRITDNLFRNCAQISFLNTNSPLASNPASDGYFGRNVMQSPGGGGDASGYTFSSGTSTVSPPVFTVASKPPIGSRFCGKGVPAGLDGSDAFVSNATASGGGNWNITIQDLSGNVLNPDANAGSGWFAWGCGNGVFPGALWLAGGGWFILFNHLYDCPGDGLNIQGDVAATIIGNEIDNFGLAGRAGATYAGINIARQSLGATAGPGSVPATYLGNNVKLRGSGTSPSSAPACATGTTATTYVWHAVTVPVGVAGNAITISWIVNRSHLSGQPIPAAKYYQYAWNVVPSSTTLNIHMAGGNVEDGSIPNFQLTSGSGTVTIYRPVTTRYLAVTTNYTAQDGDYITAGGASTTISTPTATYPGARFKVVSNTGINTITIAASIGSTINGDASITIVNSRYTAKEVVCDGTNWFAT
jgi:hypothetical protein